MFKKGEGMSMQKILVLVIVVLVLIAIVLFLNRANLTQWINNLPGYSSGEDRDVDVNNVSDKATAISCTVKVGRVASATGLLSFERNNLSVFDDRGVLQGLNNIYWYMGSSTIQDLSGRDKVLGSVTQTGGNYKISMNPLGMSYWFGSKLDGAYIISGTNEMCKMGTAQAGTTK